MTKARHTIPAPGSPHWHLVHDRRGRQRLTQPLPLEVTVEADYITLLNLSPQTGPGGINTIGAPDPERLGSSNVVEGEKEGVGELTVHTALGSHIPAQSPLLHGPPFSTPRIVSVSEVIFP